MNYLYLDIETCPVTLDGYFEKEEEERQKLINPVDSKVIAIGLKEKDKESVILIGEDEKDLLEKFWAYFKDFKTRFPVFRLVGFNIKSFDISFLVTRSFINRVKIQHFSLKEILDLRDYITCFRYGKSRGTLKEFGEAVGVSLVDDIDGSMIANLCFKKDYLSIKKYLLKDMELTEEVHKVTMELDIDKIRQY
jgi:uncharacterized protein YprB with RNaseH-like and TPR domain